LPLGVFCSNWKGKGRLVLPALQVNSVGFGGEWRSWRTGRSRRSWERRWKETKPLSIEFS